MPIPLSDDIKHLIDGRNFAHVATIMSDGSPHSAPVWVGREGDRIFIVTEEKSLKTRNTRRDPRLAISIVDTDNPYIEAQMRGRVTEWRPDTDLTYTDQVSKKYVGQAWPYREMAAVALFIEIDKAHYERQPFDHVPLDGAKKRA